MTNFTFMFCTERSGSNLITALMNGHRAVCGPPPSHMFRLFGLNGANYAPTSNPANWSVFVDDFIDAFGAMLGEWTTTLDRDALLKACPDHRISQAFDHLYGVECAADGAHFAFVKENYAYTIAPFLLANWSGARFVHLVRDPRDVAASWMRTAGIPGGIEDAARIWSSDQAETLKVFGQINTAGRGLRIKFEDLVSEPEATARRLCLHHDLEFDPGMLDFHTHPRTQANAGKIAAWSNLSKPIFASNTGAYRKTLTETDIRYVELVCADEMVALGYVFESDAEGLTADARASAIEALRPDLTPSPAYRVSGEAEAETRQKRQQIIDRVRGRRLGS